MKKIILLLLLAGSSVTLALGGNATVRITDASMNPLPGLKCIISAQNFPQPHAGGVAVLWRTSAVTDTNGSFTITNCVPACYAVAPVGANLAMFTFNMPVTNGTLSVQNSLVYAAPPNLSSNYPTFAQGDLRWGITGIPVWSSGAILDQNAGTVYYTVTNSIGVQVVDGGPGFFTGEILQFTNWSGGLYFVGTNSCSEQVFAGGSGLSLYSVNLSYPTSQAFALTQANATAIFLPAGATAPYSTTERRTVFVGSSSVHSTISFTSDITNNAMGIAVGYMPPWVTIFPGGGISFNNQNHNSIVALDPVAGFSVGNGTGGSSAAISLAGMASFTNVTLLGGTNQIIFAATNTAPQSPTIGRWISVQIAGDTNAWRLGLAK